MTRGIMVVAVAAAALLPAATPATADPICVGIDKEGTFGPPVGVGPVCVPYSGATHCRETEIGLSPTLIISIYACVPR